MAYDMQVVRIAYATAKSMGASDKVMLALFEAGIVESGFRNLNYGHDDSVGFLQQRPSQGWGTVEQIMDPAYATRKFVDKANRLGPDRYATAGQLAQAVQVSAFPLKYDAVKIQAESLLREVGNGATSTTPIASVGDTLSAIRKAIEYILNPQQWARMSVFVAGAFLVIFALFMLTGDNRLGDTTKKVAKLVVTRKATK